MMTPAHLARRVMSTRALFGETGQDTKSEAMLSFEGGPARSALPSPGASAAGAGGSHTASPKASGVGCFSDCSRLLLIDYACPVRGGGVLHTCSDWSRY
jgi:hypothetical protein